MEQRRDTQREDFARVTDLISIYYPVKEEYLKEKDSRGEKGTKVNKKLEIFFYSLFPYDNRKKIRRMKLAKMKIHLIRFT